MKDAEALWAEFSGEELAEPKARAVEALIGGATITEAAGRAGVSRTTLYRWFNEPRFVAAWNRAKREHREDVRAALRALAVDAVQTLRDAIATDRYPPAARIRLAWQLLKAVGADAPEPIGPTESEAVEQAWASGASADRLRPVDR